jgi:hypothetical protein
MEIPKSKQSKNKMWVHMARNALVLAVFTRGKLRAHWKSGQNNQGLTWTQSLLTSNVLRLTDEVGKLKAADKEQWDCRHFQEYEEDYFDDGHLWCWWRMNMMVTALFSKVWHVTAMTHGTSDVHNVKLKGMTGSYVCDEDRRIAGSVIHLLRQGLAKTQTSYSVWNFVVLR